MTRLQEHPTLNEAKLTRPVDMPARYPAPDLTLDSRARSVLADLYRETCTAAENESAALVNVASVAETIRTMCDVLDECVTSLDTFAAELKAHNTESEAGR